MFKTSRIPALHKITTTLAITGSLASLLLLFSPAANAQELTQQPGVLGYIHIDNPLSLAQEADTIGTQLGQSVSALLPLLGGSYLKSPGLQGIDMEKPMTFLFGLNPETGAPDLSFVVSTPSPQTYFKTFGKNFGTQMTETGTTEADAVRQFNEVTTSFDHEGHMAAIERGENPSQADYQIETTLTWFTAVNGNQVLVSPNQNLADAFSQNGTILPSQRLVPGSVLIGGQMQTIKGMIIAPLQFAMATAQLQAASSKDGAADSGMKMLDLFVQATNQIEDLQIGANLKDSNLDLFFGAKATADSEIGKWISSVGSVDPKLIQQLPANTSIAFAGRMPKSAGMAKFIFGAIAPQVMEEDAMKTYLDVLAQWDEIATGSAAGGLLMNGDQVAGLVSVISVSDGKKAREIAQSIYDAKTDGSIMKMMMEIAGNEMPEDFAPTYTKDVATLNGAPVDSFSMPLDKLIEAEIANAQTSGDAPDIQAITPNMKSFMGMFSEMRYAYFPDRILFASGPDNANTLEQLASPSGDGPNVAQTLAFAPPTAAFIYHLPFETYLNLILGLMPEGQLPEEQLTAMKTILKDVTLSMYGECKDTTATLGVRYPLAPIVEAFTSLAQIFQTQDPGMDMDMDMDMENPDDM